MTAGAKRTDYLQKVLAGYREMKQSNVAICSIVRDCRDNLKNNIPVINELKDCFLSAQVVIVENDSKDGTKKILTDWENSTKNIHILSEDIGVQTIPESSNKGDPCFSSYRIELMSSYRNKYLRYLEKNNWSLDYIIIIDLDLTYISIDGVANSFGQTIRWDAIVANGRNAKKNWYRYGYVFFDTFAFKETGEEFSYPQTKEAILKYQSTLAGLQIGTPMFRVSSAFGGLAIYRYESVVGLRYRCILNKDTYVEARCEHVTLHQDMHDRGCDHIYINPSQIVYYYFQTWYSLFKTRKWKQSLFRQSSRGSAS